MSSRFIAAGHSSLAVMFGLTGHPMSAAFCTGMAVYSALGVLQDCLGAGDYDDDDDDDDDPDDGEPIPFERNTLNLRSVA